MMTRQEAWEQHAPNKAEAARACGMSPSGFKDWLARKLAKESGGPLHGGEAVEGSGPYIIKGVSTYYNKHGEQGGQWVKTAIDPERMRAIIQAVAQEMCAELPRVALSEKPLQTSDTLCTVYTLTDAHIGMLAWGREAGEDWDLDIAERTITGCFAEAIKGSPAAAVAILNQLGDLLHYDGLTPVTPTSGHVLDADSRFTKMVEVAVRVLRRVIDMLLTKHRRVHLVLAEGNHDMASSVWLRTMFKALYENEPRISVDDSALPYYAYQHGNTLLAFHHSHLKKNAQLPLLVATQFSEMWGKTQHRYIHTGNLHHVDEKEHCGAIVFQHPTLAARDAYAARGGWHAQRGMSAITYHAEHGEVGRVTVRPEMVQ